MVFIVWLILGVLIAAGYEYLMPRISGKHTLIIMGYRLHHSFYSLIAIGYGLLFGNYDTLALGVGILIQHTVTDGFRFVSKE